MFPGKRQSNPDESFHVGTKKLRTASDTEPSMTCIENLSNEVLYEIFEYLDGCAIHQAFSSLNFRFQHLIIDSSLSLKIKLQPESELELIQCCKSVIIPNKHRILSLFLMDELIITDFLKHCIIDSSFVRLESIVLDEVSPAETLLMLLFFLKSLPRLFSLTIYLEADKVGNLDYIYRMIFSLSTLKYNKLSYNTAEDLNISIPFAMNEQFSNIEYLIINHECTLNALISMLYHTPRLCHLTCGMLRDSSDNVEIEKPFSLFNLTHISFEFSEIEFDDFEKFLMKLPTQVQVFRTKQCMDTDYLDADRWERLIKRYMPHLRSFDFEHVGDFSFLTENTSLNEVINQFTSTFWVERQWGFESTIDDKDITCSIHPFRNTWIDIYKCAEIATYCNPNIDYTSIEGVIIPNRQDIDNYSTHLGVPTQLNINDISSTEQNHSFIDKFKTDIPTVQFTRLNINCRNVPLRMLVRIIHMLPNLDSLKVSSLPLIQSDSSFDNDGMIRFLTSIKNKITKVNLENMIDIEQVDFILYLCICMQYFQVDVLEDMDLETLVRFILSKIETYIPRLTSLCLHILNADEKILHQLRKLIELENLLSNYMIKRIGNNIVIKCN